MTYTPNTEPLPPSRAAQFEAFRCHGTPDNRHGEQGRILVEVCWEKRMIRKKCEKCGAWHTLVSEVER